jgi:SCY1-like protein 2
MFAAATSFFAGSNISRSYNIGGVTTSRAATPATPGTVSATAPHAPTFKVGPWRVQSATHKTSGKRASVWDFDKRSPWLEKLNPPARERALEVLKAEVDISSVNDHSPGSVFIHFATRHLH